MEEGSRTVLDRYFEIAVDYVPLPRQSGAWMCSRRQRRPVRCFSTSRMLHLDRKLSITAAHLIHSEEPPSDRLSRPAAPGNSKPTSPRS